MPKPIQRTLIPRTRPDSVPSEWLQHLPTPEERDQFKAQLLANAIVFDVLRTIVQRRYNEIAGTRVTDYDTPNWEVRRAHKDGQAEELERLWALLPFESDTVG
jgi:hypothetical protein